MIENNIFTHDGIPCLDYTDERSKKVALVINSNPVLRSASSRESEGVVEITPRQAIDRSIQASILGTNTFRYDSGNRESAELLGQWESFLPGMSVCVALVNSTANATTANLMLIVRRDTDNTYTHLRIGADIAIGTTPLRDSYAKVINFIENGHYFLIIQNLGTAKELVMVDLWLFRATHLSTTQVNSGDAPLFVTDSSLSNIAINPTNGNVALFSCFPANFNTVVGYLNPARAGILDVASSNVVVSSIASLGASTNQTIQILGNVVSTLRTGYYYSTESRIASVTLPVGDIAVKLPDAFARNFHTGEDECKDSIVYGNDPIVGGNARLGAAVTTGGFSAATVFGTTVTPNKPETPITGTNNNFVYGYNFLQVLQPRGANQLVTTIRARLTPPVNANLGAVVFSDSGVGHVRFSATGFVFPASDSFVVPVSDKGATGIVNSGDGWMNPIVGSYHGAVNLPQAQMLGYETYNAVHVPFPTRGRIQPIGVSTAKTTPLFGVNTNDIKDLFDVGNGRLAIVTNGNELIISSPVRTWSNFPSFLDMQTLVGVQPGLTAARFKLTASNITSVISYQAGYLVSTSEGLFTINEITGIISKVNDDNNLCVFASAGVYTTFNTNSSYTVYQYDDQIKQLVQLFRGAIEPVLFTTIGSDYRKLNNNNYSYYLSRKNVVIARGQNFVYFLDENNILNNHNFASNSISYAGNIIATITTSSDNLYGRVTPFLGQFSKMSDPLLMVDSILAVPGNLSFAGVSAHIYNLGFSRYGSVNTQNMFLTQISEFTGVLSAIPFDTHAITTLSYPTGSSNVNSEYTEFNQTFVELVLPSNSPTSGLKIILNTLFYRARFASLNLATVAITAALTVLTNRIRLNSRVTYAKVAYWLTLNRCSVTSASASGNLQKVNRR
jgi:hypothetical protein